MQQLIRLLSKDTSLMKEDNTLYIEKQVPLAVGSVYLQLMRNPIKGVPKIYEVTADQNMAIVKQEYIPGPSLADILSQRSLKREEILRILNELSLIMMEVHKLGLVHRDLKPEHVLILGYQICLIDFGSARFHKKKQDTDTVLLGTPGYASPEQYGFDQSDARSDIYALGMILKEMDPKGYFKRVSDKAASVKKSDRYADVKSMLNDLNGKYWILPGWNNPSKAGKILCIAGWIFTILLSINIGDLKDIHFPIISNLVAFCYLGGFILVVSNHRSLAGVFSKSSIIWQIVITALTLVLYLFLITILLDTADSIIWNLYAGSRPF